MSSYLGGQYSFAAVISAYLTSPGERFTDNVNELCIFN